MAAPPPRQRLSQSPLSLSCTSLAGASGLLSARGAGGCEAKPQPSSSGSSGLLQHSSLFRQRELKPVLRSAAPPTSAVSPRAPAAAFGREGGVLPGATSARQALANASVKHRRGGGQLGTLPAREDGTSRAGRRSSPCPSQSPARNRTRAPAPTIGRPSAPSAAARRRPELETRQQAASLASLPTSATSSTAGCQADQGEKSEKLSTAPVTPQEISDSVTPQPAACDETAEAAVEAAEACLVEPAAEKEAHLLQASPEQQLQPLPADAQSTQLPRISSSAKNALRGELAAEAISDFLCKNGMADAAAALKARMPAAALQPLGGVEGGEFASSLHGLGDVLCRIAEDQWEAEVPACGDTISEEACAQQLLHRLAPAPADDVSQWQSVQQAPAPPWRRRVEAEASRAEASAQAVAAGSSSELYAAGVLQANGAEEKSSGEAASQPAGVPAAPVASAHYMRMASGCPEGFVDGLKEEYRDEYDPGFRIRELTESELLAEIAAVAGARGPADADVGDGQPAPALGQDGAGAGDPKAGFDELQAAAQQETPSASSRGQSASASGPRNGGVKEDTNGDAKPSEATGTQQLPNFGGATAGQAAPDSLAAQAYAAVGADEIQQATIIWPGATEASGIGTSAAQPPGIGGEATFGAYPAELQTSQQPSASAVVAPYALPAKKKSRQCGPRPSFQHAASSDAFYPVQLDGITYDSFPLRIVYERDCTGFEESKEFPIRVNSIVAARYQVLAYLGSAAFSRAVQCLDLETNTMVCIKIIKNDKDFLDQSLDEIKLLKLIGANCEDVDEKHCLRILDCFYHKEHLLIVTELLRDNLYEFSKFNQECGAEPFFTLGRLQRITRQVLIALEYIHSLWLIHADLKPENVLVKSYSRCEVKVIDFGSSCFVDDHLSSYVQSRSYRAPEVMLGLPYDQKIDIWSLGCIVAELWTGYVLFQNDCVQSLLARVLGIVGPFPKQMLENGKFVPKLFTQDYRLYREIEPAPRQPGEPSEVAPERRFLVYLPKCSSIRQRMRSPDELFVNFLEAALTLDAPRRPSATELLRHPWLTPGLYPDGL